MLSRFVKPAQHAVLKSMRNVLSGRTSNLTSGSGSAVTTSTQLYPTRFYNWRPGTSKEKKPSSNDIVINIEIVEPDPPKSKDRHQTKNRGKESLVVGFDASAKGKHVSVAGSTKPLKPSSSLKHGESTTTSKTNTPIKRRKGECIFAENKVRGIDVMRDPALNKGLAYTIEERQLAGIHGLLPPTVLTQSQQIQKVISNFRHWQDDLDKYIYMQLLLDRNEKLYYTVVHDYIDEMAPIIYTPTVGRACQNFGKIFRRPRGMYITIHDVGHIYDMLCNWPHDNVKAIVVTDGERILGLGDLGVYGMGISIGKLSLYTAMGGVPPNQCLPIALDVGTNNEDLLKDSSYLGLKQKRVTGEKYDAFVDEFMQAVVKRYGPDTLIQFEDFANQNAFRLLHKYRNQYLMFNDDIQGTSACALGGILAAMKLTGKKLSDNTYLFQGAGGAGSGIANILVSAMQEHEGISLEEAASHIWMNDIDGLITVDRPGGVIADENKIFAKNHKHMKGLEAICKEIKPTVAIGAAAQPGAFSETFLKDMASFSEKPIIMALSNPTSKAECTAEEAYRHTDGRCIFASGSPFKPVEYKGKTYFPGQGNNAYIFPGIAMGCILVGAHHITDAMFINASQTLADLVTEEHLAQGLVYPPLKDVLNVSTTIAANIVEYCYRHNMACYYPEPKDKIQFVLENQYTPKYDSFVPIQYKWPSI